MCVLFLLRLRAATNLTLLLALVIQRIALALITERESSCRLDYDVAVSAAARQVEERILQLEFHIGAFVGREAAGPLDTHDP